MFIGTDLEAEMYEGHPTAYLRIPFTVDAPARLTSLTLHLRYDDGFVAYLNGVRILGPNAPAAPIWSSPSNGNYPDASAVNLRGFNVSDFLGELVIGSNIARAFSLVGALSIVRFRNAVKESRDVGFVVWAMAVGMSCGTRFYLMAVFATIVIAVFVFTMHYFNFFARTVRERILLVELDSEANPEDVFAEFFGKIFHEHYLISMESLPGSGNLQLAYSTTIHGKHKEDAVSTLKEAETALTTALPGDGTIADVTRLLSFDWVI